MNEPVDHHYLPIFYLSRWAGTDGCVCRFSRPYGTEVKAKRVVPKGTGFEPHLYAIGGLPPQQAQAMEKEFMAKLDDKAAKALNLLESGLPDEGWDVETRNDWSRFLLTQMLRAPEDIAQLKSSVGEAWQGEMPAIEAAYAARRTGSDPATVQEYLEQRQPAHKDEFALDVGRTLMGHTRLCEEFSRMHWLVLDIPSNAYPLLTSDRPIWMTTTITEEDAFLMMPIAPGKLFTAAVSKPTQAKLAARRRGDLVKVINKLVVEHAVKYVYGQTDAMLPFIQKHMATKRHSSCLEQLAAARGYKIVANDLRRDGSENKA